MADKRQGCDNYAHYFEEKAAEFLGKAFTCQGPSGGVAPSRTKGKMGQVRRYSGDLPIGGPREPVCRIRHRWQQIPPDRLYRLRIWKSFRPFGVDPQGL